ncbi:hypothetical protein C9374_003958 [Naegleria lovaniensis]|uniref:Uncharacterized protein n=1 Tax=Naegleria lovaniensis TaxID=51637 RepID=A0AA88KT58_NAELO|nr:uncharacterized protein C9374_003958 [Naegleria lovaniensis]KAG2394194.1 hypothetical protein C9374_003958 [Naegleria lovaniensis]
MSNSRRKAYEELDHDQEETPQHDPHEPGRLDHAHHDRSPANLEASSSKSLITKRYIGCLVFGFACLMIAIMIVVVLIFSIQASFKDSYDSKYASSLMSISSAASDPSGATNLMVEIFSVGTRRRMLLNYLSNSDKKKSALGKPLKGQMHLEKDVLGNTKPTLLFINPFPESCLGAFVPAINELMADFKINCVNLRGFGNTRQATNTNGGHGVSNQTTLFTNMVKELVTIVEKQQPEESIILIGQEFSGTLIYLMLQEKGKEWIDDHLEGVVLLNSPHPKIFTDLLKYNSKQQQLFKPLLTSTALNQWASIYYGKNETELANFAKSEWSESGHFTIIKQYLSSNFKGSVGENITFSFPTNMKVDFEDLLKEEKILVISSSDHPYYVYPESMLSLDGVLTKEVKGGIWYARNNPLGFAEIIRNFVFRIISDDKSDDQDD